MDPQEAFNALAARHRRDVTELARRLGSGVDPQAWGDGMDAMLYRGHADAITIGRHLAGDRSAQTAEDLLLAVDIKDKEAEWLNKFVSDLEHGRYTLSDGSYNLPAIQSRANLYVEKIRASANEAFVETSEDDELFNWVMGGDEHCDECPMLQAASPLSKNELYTYPGEGSTPCLSNCKCHFVRVSDGKVGLKRSF